jgi:hypothetical protein
MLSDALMMVAQARENTAFTFFFTDEVINQKINFL